jgi:hypothetical protein
MAELELSGPVVSEAFMLSEDLWVIVRLQSPVSRQFKPAFGLLDGALSLNWDGYSSVSITDLDQINTL